MSAAGIFRFGDRTEREPAASFRCARCGEAGDVIRVARAGAAVTVGAPGSGTPGRDGLAPECFTGTVWQAGSGEALDAVQALIGRGRVDPGAIRGSARRSVSSRRSTAPTTR